MGYTVIYIDKLICVTLPLYHDDVIKWTHFPRYWPFVRGIHRSPVNSPHKGKWRGALMFSLICGWINDWVNNREAGDLRRYRVHYDVRLMTFITITSLRCHFLLKPPAIRLRYQCCSWRYIIIGSENYFAPNWQIAIIWTNAYLVYWRIYMAS